MSRWASVWLVCAVVGMAVMLTTRCWVIGQAQASPMLNLLRPAQILATEKSSAPDKPTAAPEHNQPVAAPGDASAVTATTDGGEDANPPGIAYAVEQEDGDFPPGLSPEARDSLGTGRVPIHREGEFRSALAHPQFGGPAVAKVGLVLVRVRDFDIQSGEFEASFFLSITSDKPMPDLHLTFANGKDIEENVLVRTPTFRLIRYSGSFAGETDVRNYPFDSQKLTVALEDATAGVDQIRFVPDAPRTSLDAGFFMPNWSVGGLTARAYSHKYPPRFSRDDLYVSRYEFSLEVDRFATSAAFSVFVPAIIIVLISLMGLWMPMSQYEVRSQTGAPMLAAAVLFHYSLSQALPATGYVTRADKLMLSVYVALLLNMLSTWMFTMVADSQHDALFYWSRLLVPPVTVAILIGGVLA
jgi:hypothetical protein